MNVLRQIALVTVAVLLATSSRALTSWQQETFTPTIGDFSTGWDGFAGMFAGYDSTPSTVECDVQPDGSCRTGTFYVTGEASGRRIRATDIVRGFSFGSGMQQIDRSSDNGIWVIIPDPVLDPAILAAQQECFKRCDAARKAEEDEHTIEYAKLKATVTSSKWLATLTGAMVGAMAPGWTKLAGIPAGAGAVYLIAKEAGADLLTAFDDEGKLMIITNYRNCRKNICKG